MTWQRRRESQVARQSSVVVEVTETVIWVCLAFTILAADVVLQWQELSRGPAKPKVQAASIPA